MTSKTICKLLNIIIIFCGIFLISGCAGSKIKQLNSDNHNDRIRYLVIHHTTIDYQDSVQALTEPHGVSSHYLIPQSNDSSYPSQKLEVLQLVDEKDRAWHAGRSYWQGQNNLNDQSIGIELVYLSPCAKADQPVAHYTGLNSNANADNLCFYPDFDEQQIGLLIDLVKGILKRNPDIEPSHIVGHSDIAADRKVDPGPRFPWQRLYKAGIGAWYEDETVTKYWNQFLTYSPTVGVIQSALAAYGYGIIETGVLDAPTINALTAFQMHFRPWEVTGKITSQTAATLFALLERYRPNHLKKLQLRFENEKIAENTDPKINYLGQFNGLFPKTNPSKRQLVNDREIFKAYRGSGEIKLTSNGATSADIFINGKNISHDLKLQKDKQIVVNIGKYTLDGYNTLKVENIIPVDSSIMLNLPFPTLANSKPELAGFSTKKLQQIDNLINKDIADGFPGATLLIVKNGKIIKNTAYGFSRRYDEIGNAIPVLEKMHTDTLFDMASNTKMYATNYALMKLASEDKLDITAPISRYIAEYRGQGRDSRSVKDLLTHSAGYAPSIAFYAKDNSLGERFYSQNKENTQYLLTQRLPFEIGRGVRATYSDIDYMLLGTLVERITGKALDEYVESEIYKPLGLSHTVFNPLQKGFDRKNIAATELMGNTRGGRIQFDNIRESVIQGEVHDEKAFYSMAGVAGHAGLFSTAEDTAVLASVMLNRGGYGDITLFDKSIIDQFTKPSDLNISMGLGWRRAGNGESAWHYGPYASPYAYGHTGWTGTVTIIDPFYDLIIILLTNKKHSPMIAAEVESEAETNYQFAGDSFETGKYGSIIALIYEAFLEKN